MSFSGEVKEELLNVIPHEDHCKKAEYLGLYSFYNKGPRDELENLDENVLSNNALRKCFTIRNKTINMVTTVKNDSPLDIVKKPCCKKSFLRGAFISSGFIGDPARSYQFEILSESEDYARLLILILGEFAINAKVHKRGKYYVVYVKEVESIMDCLNIMGAHKSMMEFANARILKDVRNDVNRRNNCDMANISKAVNAASKQIDDIELIRSTVGFESLSEALREICVVRLNYPESSLAELGSYLNPPIGKSGVNHRLRKISEFADSLRK